MPADEPFLRAMLWLAANRRDESAAADAWPDEDVPRRYVAGFGRPGDTGVIAEADGEPAGAAWYRLLPAADAGRSGGSVTWLATLAPSSRRTSTAAG